MAWTWWTTLNAAPFIGCESDLRRPMRGAVRRLAFGFRAALLLPGLTMLFRYHLPVMVVIPYFSATAFRISAGFFFLARDCRISLRSDSRCCRESFLLAILSSGRN